MRGRKSGGGIDEIHVLERIRRDCPAVEAGARALRKLQLQEFRASRPTQAAIHQADAERLEHLARSLVDHGLVRRAR